jgi:predicted acetyltransferase
MRSGIGAVCPEGRGRRRVELLRVATTFREYRDSDRDELLRLWSIAFRSGREMESDFEVVDHNSVYVASDNGRLVGGFTVEHMTASCRGADLRCGGVAAVAILPESRRAGVGAEMMRFALERMKSDRYDLSSLYPYREGYYRRLGYEVCGRRTMLSVPGEKLPRPDSDLTVRTLTPGSWDGLPDVYAAFAERYAGMHKRTEREWKALTKPADPAPLIFAVGSPAEAYVVIRQPGEFWGETSVTEICWATRAGYLGALGVLARFGINRSKVSWYEPSDSPFLAGFLDRGVEASVSRPIMFRAIDAASSLGAIQTEASGEFAIRVTDGCQTPDAVTLRVAFSPNGVEATPAADADIEMTVCAFTQALLGEPSFGRLLANGLATSKSDAAARAMAALLPPSPVYCMEFF